MLHSSFDSILETRDPLEYEATVVRFAKQLGFDLVTAMSVIDRDDGRAEFFGVDNAPQAYRESMDDPNQARIDPVMQHCKYRSTPIIWDRRTYLQVGRIDKWEMQAQFGYRAGICLALHMPGGRHFVIGVDRDQALPQDLGERTRMVSELQLFAVYAQESAERVLLPASDIPTSTPRLTAQEIDCLRWTMEGRTMQEVGEILHLADTTVLARLGSAQRKLSCVNVAQAVLKALRLGLIR